jgi:hypothetical protein
VFLLLSIQSIRPTYFGKTINDLISIYFNHIYYHRVVTIQFC